METPNEWTIHLNLNLFHIGIFKNLVKNFKVCNSSDYLVNVDKYFSTLHAIYNIDLFFFSSLLCLNMDRLIRIKFIEGCLANISKNESVAISLRLLPKLFQSFQNFRGMDTHEVSMFAERRHNMMRLFFDNLKTYTENNKSGVQCPFFNHLAQIQVRLQFLSVIFSVQVSIRNGKFVTKIVLTYCEKKLFYWSRKTFETRGWRLRICKFFEITRTIYSNSERSEQFLVTECFFNLFQEVSHI